ncbi:MAG TPA: sugar-transfer associated ATP-grasp domain-containing protein [Bacilli bacterium]|jgi:hypothetical protein|nr:sugar-transfer associated ATP-grasp domain-containing protein [Bacilli bacterium]HQC83380.1 sugar-transfer associated ATP-grasp domain-containing protein [Bacilli bacterium]
MGIFKFALRGNYKRHYENLKELASHNGKSPQLMFIDTALCTLVTGSGLQDYLNYKFYDKTWKERKEYATIGYQSKFYKLAASEKYFEFFSNKVNFNHNFHKFVKREEVSYADGYDKVEEFIKTHESVIRKPINGLGGARVEKIMTKDIKEPKDFYKKLGISDCMIEEEIIQDPEWAKLSPNSINTLRIVTKCIRGKSDILYAVARIGSGKSIVDNFHQGGVGVRINTDKGILEGICIGKDGVEHDVSPASGIKVDGFKIPYWNEIKDMVCEAAKVNDAVNIVGWDVAISTTGPVIIEGNRGPGMDLIQVLYNRGVKSDLEEIKKEILNN